jgi:integrase
MKGHIRQRGPTSWQLKLDVGSDSAGGRRTEFHTFRGSKRGAQMKLAELIASVGKGAYVSRSAVKLGDYVLERLDQWERLGRITPMTIERYRDLLRNQIRPFIGHITMQDLKAEDVERWHATLLTAGRKDGAGGLSAQTIQHAHRVLAKALKEAQRFDVIARNPAVGERPPKVTREEVIVLRPNEVRAIVTSLRDHPVYTQMVLGLFGGLRRGEVLALRWGHVDLSAKNLKVCASLEETTAGGLRFKEPKSAAGKREVSLPDIAVEALREHWKRQLELSMRLGAGKPSPDMLIFTRLNGEPVSPRAFSKAWGKAAASIGVQATFHALRHTHISHLISAGIDVVKISKRVGHADIATTLNEYAHLFDAREDKSAGAINAAVATLLGP